MSMMCVEDGLKVFFHCLDLTGPQNACVGLAQALAKRNHRIYFVITEMFEGQFRKFGFNELIIFKEKNSKMILKNQSETLETHPMRMMTDVIENLIKLGVMSNLSSTEKLKRANESDGSDYWSEIYENVREYQPQFETMINREKPDLIIVNNFLIPPCIIKSQVPWAYSCSCNPTILFLSDDLPPAWSGLPLNNRNGWQEHRNVLSKLFLAKIRKYQSLLNVEFGLPEVEPEENFYVSKFFNIYGYPEELDYTDDITVPENYVHLDAFCRELADPFEIPKEFKTKIKPNDKLIFLSMGSIGSIDVSLMERLVDELKNSPHKYIVSKGALAEEYELADNMWGMAYLPQTKVLPLVDLVVTHGGNNTVTEALSFGKPMLVMPLFYDQYDNAQRIDEKGYGIKIDPMSFQNGQIVQVINRMLKNAELLERCRRAGERITQSQSKDKACQKIESLISQFQKK